jgi:hypothetical protein
MNFERAFKRIFTQHFIIALDYCRSHGALRRTWDCQIFKSSTPGPRHATVTTSHKNGIVGFPDFLAISWVAPAPIHCHLICRGGHVKITLANRRSRPFF